MKKHCVNCDFVLPETHKIDCPYCGLSPDLLGKKAKWASVSTPSHCEVEPLTTHRREGVTTFIRNTGSGIGVPSCNQQSHDIESHGMDRTSEVNTYTGVIEYQASGVSFEYFVAGILMMALCFVAIGAFL